MLPCHSLNPLKAQENAGQIWEADSVLWSSGLPLKLFKKLWATLLTSVHRTASGGKIFRSHPKVGRFESWLFFKNFQALQEDSGQVPFLDPSRWGDSAASLAVHQGMRPTQELGIAMISYTSIFLCIVSETSANVTFLQARCSFNGSSCEPCEPHERIRAHQTGHQPSG